MTIDGLPDPLPSPDMDRREYAALSVERAGRLRKAWRAMMPTPRATTPRGAPYPLRSWPPDAAIDIQALAEWADAALATAGHDGARFQIDVGPITVIGGSQVGTTDTNGHMSVAWQAFPTAALMFLAMDGDSGTSGADSVALLSIATGTLTPSGVYIRFIGHSGSVFANATRRCSWLAVGY